MEDTTFLDLSQRKQVCGLPPHWVLPPLAEVCVHQKCCGRKRMKLPLVSVSLGNIVVAPQAVEVLRCLEIPDDAWVTEEMAVTEDAA